VVVLCGARDPRRKFVISLICGNSAHFIKMYFTFFVQEHPKTGVGADGSPLDQGQGDLHVLCL
jgi:hypothetical protein